MFARLVDPRLRGFVVRMSSLRILLPLLAGLVMPWPLYEVGDGDVSCPLQLQENVEMRGDVVREISCDTGGADSLPVRPCEGLCARQEGRPNNSPPTVKSENKTTRRRYQEKKVKERISKIA